MGTVASFGSINLDRVARPDADTLAALAAEYDWFPRAGETRPVDAVPDAVAAHVEETLLGGKGANQAVAAAAADAETALYGRVGANHERFDVLERLAERGVDTTAVGVADAPTGTAYVFVAPDGENHIAIVGGANDAVDPAYAREHLDAIGRRECLLVQNELPAAAADALLSGLDGRSDRPTVVFDPAPAEGAGALLAHDCVDVVTPNEGEARALADELAAFEGAILEKHGADPVVVTRPDGEQFTVSPPAADVVDTTGAGDVFAGYVAASLARGRSLREAVERGCVAGALSVESAGGQRATPSAAATAAARDRRRE